ncbi:glycine/betaine ABC transporter substrate-binding protein [Fusobacterium nucleatum subsp. nucleatum ATCC 25586]|uniref:Glycine betaine transport system permease protein n=1 Tax=Fusobacterium nucleatum subsp. nucleatum (strain ATCC 25586 / DSM 15643 / BCRC 10681 / CIP 101130 / JCM 8532 / KCTC 2640 / LMG 13131 / VPI 4355) TaxID=190304 RepID=Q8RHK5_FUSNN|nr:glycine betaine ABC transporter substrate-binding protein [Fusobacterium nucleatum]AAL94099.1 Glycine betaine transport system permease protein [Fusobacterium nucleatum subsp. nucleatum ATCC 25586]AVQ14505.1 glycine/betaine ABC transporter substrate-binding protein [Fusobacterium nucleatum subsp. nucleatum ATCC 25586]WMS29307.1 glycine betaine ABC transporter substrate-binding protein [Fusobacterium nucleatum]
MINQLIKLLTENFKFFLNLTIEHILISLLAISIASVLGIILGIIISEYRKFSGLILGTVNILYTIPSIALLGFFITITGVGNTTALIALIIYALLPIIRSTYTGIITINPLIIEASEGMGSTKLQQLFKVKIPLALPVLMSGIRNMVTMTIALAGIASFVGAGGLGVAIYRGITTNNSAMTFLGSLLIAILALVFDFILGLIEKRLTNHKRVKYKINLKVIILGLFIVIFGAYFSLNSKKDKTINIATKPMTEGYILGQMLTELIEQDTDLKVNITNGVGGGTSNIHPAIVKGEFDLYPEYTGTSWETVLKKEGSYDESKFDELQKEYKEKYNLEYINLYGFNNTYGLAVNKDIAKKYNLKTYSDLAKASNNLIFGAEYDFFEREDGYKELQKVYNMNFKKQIDMDIGLKYQAMKDKKIDVMVIFTTDGQLAISDVVVLEDDKKMYPSYRAGTVIRSEILSEYPELKPVLEKLNNILDDKTMADLNYQVESEGKKPEDVAREYLQEKGLLEAR